MENFSELDKFYSEIMDCQNTSRECPGIWKNIKEGIPPRGFYYESNAIKILVVAKNPGHPLSDEKKNYKNKSGKELYASYREFRKKLSQKIYDTINNDAKVPERSNIFHKNLFRYMSFFLDIPVEEIYSQMGNTNLVKCSTKMEQGKLPKETIERCYHKFFLKELSLLRPKVIIAMGREVEKYLIKHQNDFNYIPIIYVKHPTVHYKKDEEKKKLRNIKKKIEKYI
ncbi:MAG: uracil-DNA glycosylase family protein [Nitrospira sp.]|nr:uracil-DNA glycosylase family protein [Nitrospira sp.]